MTTEKALTLKDLYIHIREEETDIEYINYWKPLDGRVLVQYKEQQDIRTDCYSSCITCQVTHIEKYKALFPDTIYNSREKLKENPLANPTHPFQIKCGKIPVDANYLSMMPSAAKDNTSDEEMQILTAMMDPVSFGRKYFGWEARRHQELALRCTSSKKVFRWGRRSGKSEAFAIDILWNVFTRQVTTKTPEGESSTGARILVVTPYDSQVSEIFDKINTFLGKNPNLEAERITSTKTPFHRMTFKNGAEIRGFTTGAHEAESLRGQDADILYLDEADYMSEGDFKTIMPVVNSKFDVPVRAASTPSGRREKYYNWCNSDPQWKEFYFPTPVIDLTPISQTKMSWAQMRRNMRNEFSKDGWLQEVMAIFIAMATGVYHPELISKAMESYNYDDMKQYWQHGYLGNWRTSIGVDWNSTAGTWIYVMGYSPQIGFKVFGVENVSKQEFTQLQGLNRITEMIEFWRPDYVYVDAGYGATNWEMLQMWANNCKSEQHGWKIKNKIKKYEFGGAIEIREATTGKIVKHPAKAYMVENSVRKFEDNVVKFSSQDETLRKQLLNYIVRSRAESGKPLYDVDQKSVGDHALDAFNLSLVAWAMEEGAFAVNSRQPITTVGILGTATHALKSILPTYNKKNEYSEKDIYDIGKDFGFKNLAPTSSDPEKQNHSITIERPDTLSVNARSALYGEVNQRLESLEKRHITYDSNRVSIPTIRHGFLDETEHLHVKRSSTKGIMQRLRNAKLDVKRRGSL